jgi:hypothetical protein
MPPDYRRSEYKDESHPATGLNGRTTAFRSWRRSFALRLTTS